MHENIFAQVPRGNTVLYLGRLLVSSLEGLDQTFQQKLVKNKWKHQSWRQDLTICDKIRIFAGHVLNVWQQSCHFKIHIQDGNIRFSINVKTTWSGLFVQNFKQILYYSTVVSWNQTGIHDCKTCTNVWNISLRIQAV